jgi:RHS repeat-associated protein
MGSLIAVSLPDGRLIEYILDGKGRRIAKLVNGVVVKQWLWSYELRIAGELDAVGNLASEYIYGTALNIPDLIVSGSKTYRVVTDHLGSPLMIVNTTDSSDVLFQAQCDAWGNRTVTRGSEDVIPFGFAGGFYDPDTNFTRFGQRDYVAAFGRWASKDRIGFRGGSANLFVYGNGDPINSVDYDGTSLEAILGIIVAAGETLGAAALGALACFALKGDDSTDKPCPPCPQAPPDESRTDTTHDHWPCPGAHYQYEYNQNPV